MEKKLQFHLIKKYHESFWNNWDQPFSKNQYANWKTYDVNDIQFLIQEIERLTTHKLKLSKIETMEEAFKSVLK